MNPHRRKLHCRNADRRNSVNYDATIYNFGDVAFDEVAISLHMYLYTSKANVEDDRRK